MKQNGLNIKYIENPTEKVQLATLKQNKDAIKYIRNPSKKIIDFLKSLSS
ncbi:MAG: hypothetical protein NZZ41_02015 [Candidatus Dojkabacteria bacterium]|nr:hypothetical protein [Candidatus Dojkabacteria bacterium]